MKCIENANLRTKRFTSLDKKVADIDKKTHEADSDRKRQ